MGRFGIKLLVLVSLCLYFLEVNGQSHCSGKVTIKSCPSGTHTCTCPGDQQEVSYRIQCKKKGLWCGRPTSVNSCHRYSPCHSCKPWAENDDLNVCTKCLKKGFRGGKCTDDINECRFRNGDCAHFCHNTRGSYYCTCKDGFDLGSNRHKCIRKSCGPPPKLDDMKAVSETKPGARHWQYETSAIYSCTNMHQVVFGNAKLTCGLTSDNKNVTWHGSLAGCTAQCDADAKNAECGVPGVNPLVCDQLGCCAHEGNGTCHLKQGNLYIEYKGIHPTPSSDMRKSRVNSTSSCKNLCNVDEKCLSFAVSHTYSRINCYLYKKNRSDYQTERQLRRHPSFTYYAPLNFQDDIDYRVESGKINKQFEYGCYDSKTVEEHLPLVASSENLMTGMKCSETCKNLGYGFSGVKMNLCRCGINIQSNVDLEDSNTTVANEIKNQSLCLTNCTGDASQTCGGESAYTIRHAPKDNRYIGCYKDVIHHFPIRKWHRNQNKTVGDCIQACADIQQSFAAVQNGGACFCGTQYPFDVDVGLEMCNEPCVANRHDQWCGSIKYNSVYRTHAAFDLTSIEVSHFAVGLYHEEETIESIDPYMFTFFPHLQCFVTKKLVLSALHPFMAPQEDHFCSSGQCYQPCGALNMADQVIGNERKITIRKFIVRYSEVIRMLRGKTPIQVNIYAQALYIDTNLVLDYALMIRARQIFINRHHAASIQVTSKASNLGVNSSEWKRITRDGPHPDMFFERLSYTCAQMLINTKEQKYINIGHAIINDLIVPLKKDKEHEAMIRAFMAMRSKMLGVDLTNTHLVPMYTKNHLVKILNTYYRQISIYKNDYDRLSDSKTLYKDFLTLAEKMNDNHKETVVKEAKVKLRNVKSKYSEVVKIQEEIEKNYLQSSKKVEMVREHLMKDIQDAYEDAQRRARSSFLGFLGRIFKSIIGVGYKVATLDLEGAIFDIAGAFRIEKPEDLKDAFEQLSNMVIQIDLIMQKSKIITLGDNEIVKEREGELIIDLQTMVSMSVSIVQWKAMKNYADIVINDLELPSARQFRIAMSDFCTWGEAMSQAMVDRAETLRQVLENRAVYDIRKLQEKRTKKVISDAKSSVDKRLAVMHVMQEQMLDVSLDLNEVLLQFCQAYFFENLRDCGPTYRPMFGGSMSDILLRINAAEHDALYSHDIVSTVSRSAVLVDKDATPECSDQFTCPIKYLNKERHLILTISPNHTDFSDVQKYRVKEISVKLKNLDSRQTRMKFYLRNTGLFYDRREKVFNFLTRPILRAYEKMLDDGHISIKADFPDEIHRITPFTTWVIQIADDKGRLDLSSVDEIQIRFDGTAIV